METIMDVLSWLLVLGGVVLVLYVIKNKNKWLG